MGLNRGEIWTVAGGGDATGKPRPVMVLQSDRFDGNDSITVCPLTSDLTDLGYMRVFVEPSVLNGLRLRSAIMVDKVTTVWRRRTGMKLGELSPVELADVDRAVMTFLGLAKRQAEPRS